MLNGYTAARGFIKSVLTCNDNTIIWLYESLMPMLYLVRKLDIIDRRTTVGHHAQVLAEGSFSAVRVLDLWKDSSIMYTVQDAELVFEARSKSVRKV